MGPHDAAGGESWRVKTKEVYLRQVEEEIKQLEQMLQELDDIKQKRLLKRRLNMARHKRLFLLGKLG